MKEVEFENTGKPLAPRDLLWLRSKWEHALPSSYEAFLRQTNGGQPWPDTIDVKGLATSPTDVQVIFGFGRDVESSDLRWNIENFPGLIAEAGLLPVGRDSGGGLFCLDSEGKVFFVEMDGLHQHLVAKSFGDFVVALREY
ncbi:MAG: SMI1/KNR4 family protein [Spirochaetales bacterium]|nr:SMI1/KNR4 family protein [Leptospiraceae bacterium]MCP5481129.1 SMI1/KNR4 family protein [Spirochaetales bacterium]